MTIHLKPNQIRNLRLRAQALHLRQTGGPAATVRQMVGVQAQEAMAARLALWARSRELVGPQVDQALAATRTVVRTWSLRGTLHLHAAQDLGWLLPILGPVFIRKSRRRFTELGLTEEIYNQARPALEAILASEGPLRRAELAKHLSDQGIPTAGQAAYHLIRRAGLDGLLCYGPDRAGKPTFALLKEWIEVDEPLYEQAALVRLARRYLTAYGPARPEDLATWSGLPIPSARTGFDGLGSELEKVTWDGAEVWLLKGHAEWLTEQPPEEYSVRLLPGYDPYLLGYRGRGLMVPPEYAGRVHPGGGTLRATLLVNGRAAGLWHRKHRTHDVIIQVQPFEELPTAVIPALEA